MSAAGPMVVLASHEALLAAMARRVIPKDHRDMGVAEAHKFVHRPQIAIL